MDIHHLDAFDLDLSQSVLPISMRPKTATASETPKSLKSNSTSPSANCDLKIQNVHIAIPNLPGLAQSVTPDVMDTDIGGGMTEDEGNDDDDDDAKSMIST